MTRRVVELLAWVGGVALIFGAGYLWGREAVVRDITAARNRAVEQRDTYRDSLREAMRAVRVDSVRVDSIVTRWRTVRDSIVLPGDTVVRVDTVRVLLRAADAAVTACTDALGGCQRALALASRRAVADSLAFARLDDQLSIATALPARSRWRGRLEGVAACAAGTWTINALRR